MATMDKDPAYQQWRFAFKTHPESVDMNGGKLLLYPDEHSIPHEFALDTLTPGDLELAHLWNLCRYLHPSEVFPCVPEKVVAFLQRITERMATPDNLDT